MKLLIPPACIATQNIPVSIGAIEKRGGSVEKQILIDMLLQRLPGFPPTLKATALETDSLGRPHIAAAGFSVSFSSCAGMLYGAAARSATLGIDVAAAAEFSGIYPFHRVFQEQELILVASFFSSRSESAAFLWACKEAAVKAVGTGFRNMQPRSIEITACRPHSTGFTVEICNDATLSAGACRIADRWLAVAIRNPAPKMEVSETARTSSSIEEIICT